MHWHAMASHFTVFGFFPHNMVTDSIICCGGSVASVLHFSGALNCARAL